MHVDVLLWKVANRVRRIRNWSRLMKWRIITGRDQIAMGLRLAMRICVGKEAVTTFNGRDWEPRICPYCHEDRVGPWRCVDCGSPYVFPSGRVVGVSGLSYACRECKREFYN